MVRKIRGGANYASKYGSFFKTRETGQYNDWDKADMNFVTKIKAQFYVFTRINLVRVT
jgi:hypothetical protein